MTALGAIYYLLQIFLAGVIFFYVCPKRKYFILRLLLCVGVSLALGYFMPIPEEWKYDQVYAFFRHLILFSFTFFTAWICFDLKVDVTLALSVAASGVQHIAYRIANITAQFLNRFGEIVTEENWSYLEMTVCAVVVFAAYFIVGRYAAKREYYKNHDKRLNAVAVLTIFICNVMTRFSRAEELNDAFIVNLYAIMCCVLALVLQFAIHRMVTAAAERRTMEKLWEEERKQYQITKQTIDAINVKCHDMKHKLSSSALASEAEEVKDLIHIYDNSLKTGNKVLNVVMMDYGLRYGKEDVEITFMGNGACLNFLSDTDQYSLFGNALSNAVEAVLKLPDVEKRTISVTLEEKGDFISLGIVNYFNGEIAYDGGEIATTKDNALRDHGYGVKSMKLIAEKYGGELKIFVKEDVFRLNMYFLRNA